jgi:hypothetical protein
MGVYMWIEGVQMFYFYNDEQNEYRARAGRLSGPSEKSGTYI